MELSQDIFTTLENNLEASNNDNYEFEILFKDDIDHDGFQRIISYLNSTNHYELEKTLNRESLDVRTVNDENSDIRLTITGKSNILQYCRSNSVSEINNVHIMRKKRAPNVSSLFIDDYNIRNNVNIEENLSNDDELKVLYASKLRKSEKYYRYKKRYTFVHKHHKVDLSIVKSSINNSKNMIRSGVLNAKETFEVEIEALPYTNVKTSEVLNAILKTIGNLLKVNNNVTNLISKTKQNYVLSEYLDIVDSSVLKKSNINLVLKNPSRYYLRYQPVTLVKKNLLPKDVDVSSILEDYSVTEKADGDRLLIFVDKEKEAYSIDSKLRIKKLGITHKKISSCIIDGEYIEKGKLGISLQLYLAFDLYYLNGKDVRDDNLTKRLSMLKDIMVEENWINNSRMSLSVKEFYSEKNIFENSKKVFDKIPTLPYHTDGLIYTPIHLPPGALYKNDNTMNAFGGTWSKVFKWKPPEENSIDVLVKFGKDAMIKTDKLMQKCLYVELFVAYKGNLEENVDILDIYDKLGNSKNGKIVSVTNKIVKRYYDHTYLPIEYGNKYPTTTMYNEVINDDTIIEFAYNPNHTNSYLKWIPLRIRKDKTSLYKMNNKNIENAANSYNTVMNVWMSINEPVTKDMIVGNIALDPEEVKLDTKDIYYARETPRYRSQLRPMLDFHNYWVKKKSLFDKFGGKGLKLLEIGCGQGGDLQKWIDNKFSIVLGLDNNEDNLLNSDHGIYKRMYESVYAEKDYLKLNLKEQKMMFLLLDGGVKWTKDVIQDIDSNVFKRLTQIAMGTIDKGSIKNNLLHSMYDVMNEGFNLISCQFAIHYFFQDSNKLDAFCYNINSALMPGGSFIGTALDGNLVNELFKDDSIVNGIKNDKILWQIEKKYDYYNPLSNTDENLGKQIDVYVETINKIIPEYLVDFELLKRKLSQYNIHLKASGSFEMLWDSLIHAHKKGSKHWAVTSAVEGMDPILKKYSFLNRWFIFEKYT